MKKNFSIRKPDHVQSDTSQISVPDLIPLLSFLRIMLSAVEFYDQLRFWTIEINDVITNWLLPIKLQAFKLFSSKAGP